jgi:serine/threonine protein kinase
MAVVPNILNINEVVKPNKNIMNRIMDVNSNQYTELKKLNLVVKNNISPRYNVLEYLGEGVNGSLYLAEEDDKYNESRRRLILKRINLPENPDPELNHRINFELNVLNYLSNDQTTRDYINPCMAHKMVGNHVLTLFPVFKGYSLKHLTKYLIQLTPPEYYKIVFHLIKTVLFAMTQIHQNNIAHQNISENNILVSTYDTPNQIKIKITDFGLGCNQMNPETMLVSNPGMPDSQIDYFKKSTCRDKLNISGKITAEVLEKLTDIDYLSIAQKNDLFRLGVIFLGLLLRSQFDKPEYKSLTPVFIRDIKENIINKYLDGENKLEVGKEINRLNEDVLEYLDILNKYVFCGMDTRRSCRFVLDKIIVYEKYKNDIF